MNCIHIYKKIRTVWIRFGNLLNKITSPILLGITYFLILTPIAWLYRLFNRTEEEVTKERAMKALREFLRPEFIGRIDEIIVFNKLTKDDYAKIAGLMLNEMKEPLLEKQITLNVTEDACKLIAEKAYGKTYGAREIRRVIRQEVEDQIAECIIHNANTLRALTITAKDGKLVVQDEEVTA